MDRDGREVALAKEAVELGGTANRLDEDADLRATNPYQHSPAISHEGSSTHLVELERIKKVVQLAVLGAFLEANKVLLESVKGELLLVVDVDLEGLREHP